MSSTRKRYLLWGAAAVSLAAIAYLVVQRKRASASSATVDTSGRPGPDLSGSAAQTPSGGGSSSAGSLPDVLVTQPDPLGQQVQTFDTAAAAGEAPTMAPTSPYTPMPGTFAAETNTPITIATNVGSGGVVGTGGMTALVDASGHVVNAKGARVGGRPVDA